MNARSCFLIANKNIKKKPVYIRIAVAYFLLSFFLVSFILLSVLVSNKQEVILKGKKKDNCARTLYSLTIPEIVENYVSETWISREISSGANITRTTINGNDCYSNFYLNVYQSDYSNAVPKSLDLNIVAGKLPSDDKEILLSNLCLRYLSLNEEDVVGKTISFSYGVIFGNLVNEYFIKNVTVSGVFTEKNKDYAENNIGSVFISKNISDEYFCNAQIFEDFNYSFYVFYKDFSGIKTKTNNLNKKYNLNLEIQNYEMLFLFSNLEKYGNIFLKIFFIFMVVITIGVLIYALTLGYIDFATNYKQYMVLCDLGLEKKNIKSIILSQHLLIYFVAYLLSLLMAILLIVILSMVLKNTFELSIKLRIIHLAIIIFVPFFINLIIVMLISFLITIFRKAR